MTAAPPGSPARVAGVVFDLDGTLVDGYEGITTAVNAARSVFNLPALPEADVRARVGAGLSSLMEDVLGPERAAHGAVAFRKEYERVCESQTRAAPELYETLDALRGLGVRLSVASNKPAPFSIRILERLGVRPYFDTIEGPETAGALKPEPAMIAACLTAMGVLPADALYVGDMTIDGVAGARAGVPVVLVCGGSSPPEELRATGWPVITSLGGLLDLPGLNPASDAEVPPATP